MTANLEETFAQTIKDFAAKYRLHTKVDPCGHTIIPGKQFCLDMPKRLEYRSHIYDGFLDGRLGLCLLLATKRRWTKAKKKLIAAGFTIKQNGDQEGCALFDPDNDVQARLALKLARVHTIRNRVYTPEQRQAIAERLRKSRRQCKPEGLDP